MNREEYEHFTKDELLEWLARKDRTIHNQREQIAGLSQRLDWEMNGPHDHQELKNQRMEASDHMDIHGNLIAFRKVYWDETLKKKFIQYLEVRGEDLKNMLYVLGHKFNNCPELDSWLKDAFARVRILEEDLEVAKCMITDLQLESSNYQHGLEDGIKAGISQEVKRLSEEVSRCVDTGKPLALPFIMRNGDKGIVSVSMQSYHHNESD